MKGLIVYKGVPEDIRDQCEFYFYPGRMILNNLSWKDRFMLRMGARLTKDPAAKKTMLRDYNDVKKENITSLASAIKKIYTATKETIQPA